MLILILAVTLSQSGDKIAVTERGSSLYQSCKANVRVMDMPEPSVHDASEGKICQAYISGFLDGDAFGDNMICSEGATIGTLTRVYVAYMEKNPKLMDEPKVAGLYEALAVGYPCALKPEPKKPR